MQDEIGDHPEEEAASRRASWRHLLAVCAQLELYFLALFMMLPCFQEYLNTRACATLAAADCSDSAVSGLAATNYQELFAANSGTCLLTNALLSAASDAVGRRRVLLLTAGVGVAPFVGPFVVALFGWPLPLTVPFFIFGGLGGGMGTCVAVSIASIADVTPPALRSSYISIAMGTVYVAGVLGPTAGGAISKRFGHAATFGAAAALQALSFLAVAVAFRETLPAARRREGARAARPALSLRSAFEPVHFLFVGARSRSLAALGAIYLLQYFVLSGTFSVLILLVTLKGQVAAEGFDDAQVGYTVSLNYAGKAAAVLLLLPLFLRRHGHPLLAPLLGLRAGCAVAAVAYLFYPLATRPALLYALTFLEGLDTVWETCLHALVSLLTTAEAQGRAFGGLSFLRTAINLLGPTVCNSVWAATVSVNVNISFYVFSAVSVVSLLAASALKPVVLRDGALLEEAERQKAGAEAAAAVGGGKAGGAAGVAPVALALGPEGGDDGGGCDELRAALLPTA